MLFLNRSCYTVNALFQKTNFLGLDVFKNKQSKLVLFRLLFNFNIRKPNESSLKFEKNKEKKHSAFEPLSGPDDENFTEHLKQGLKDLSIPKAGFFLFLNECQKFYHETVEDIKEARNERVGSPRGRIDLLYKFETENDLKGFKVASDATFDSGYSSANLKLTENETALFSGNICTDIPKSGTSKRAGFANLTGPSQQRAFFRCKFHDWSEYTHLVFKIRGDGRTYLVLLHTPNEYIETGYIMYGQPLFTRGGPYWQIVKMPFNHFFIMKGGSVIDRQSQRLSFTEIVKMGITVGGYDGPFKLEIEYIGLEAKDLYKQTSAYEMYRNFLN